MADFVEAARLDQIPPGKGTCVKVGGKDVALFNVDGTIYALDDTCPHAGSSLGTSKARRQDRDLPRARNEVRRHDRVLCGHCGFGGRLLPGQGR